MVTAFRIMYDITKYNHLSMEIGQLKVTGEMDKPLEGFQVNSKGDAGRRW